MSQVRNSAIALASFPRVMNTTAPVSGSTTLVTYLWPLRYEVSSMQKRVILERSSSRMRMSAVCFTMRQIVDSDTSRSSEASLTGMTRAYRRQACSNARVSFDVFPTHGISISRIPCSRHLMRGNSAVMLHLEPPKSRSRHVRTRVS